MGLWKKSSSGPCSTKGQLQQVLQDKLQSGFEYLQDCTMLSGQSVPVFHLPHSKIVLYLKIITHIVICAHCLVLPWDLLKGAWLYLLYTLPTDIYTH